MEKKEKKNPALVEDVILIRAKKKRTQTNKKANKSKSSDAKMGTKQFVIEGFQEA